jgi:hypothetical protein
MWIRELAIGWERVYKPSEHASASVTRGTRDAVPTLSFVPCCPCNKYILNFPFLLTYYYLYSISLNTKDHVVT